MDIRKERSRWLKMNPLGYLPVWQREKVWYCQRSEQWTRAHWKKLEPKGHVHHILPVADGGGACGPENLIYLCTDCHKAQHRMTHHETTEICNE
jgi:5-methylcytosine-specific restriction endonuclease McrA